MSGNLSYIDGQARFERQLKLRKQEKSSDASKLAPSSTLFIFRFMLMITQR